MFLHGENRGDPDDIAAAPFIGPDLPRNSEGRALIGDPRNDENLIVSQLHSTFLKFHNRMVESVFEEWWHYGNDLFKEAQRRVRWHAQSGSLPKDAFSRSNVLEMHEVVQDSSRLDLEPEPHGGPFKLH